MLNRLRKVNPRVYCVGRPRKVAGGNCWLVHTCSLVVLRPVGEANSGTRFRSLNRDFDVFAVHFFQCNRVPIVVAFFGSGVIETCPRSQADFFDNFHQSVSVNDLCNAGEGWFDPIGSCCQ